MKELIRDDIDKMRPEEIHREIMKYVNADVSYIDALVIYAEKHDLEIEVLGEIIKKSPIIKSKVRDDAERLNLVDALVGLPI